MKKIRLTAGVFIGVMIFSNYLYSQSSITSVSQADLDTLQSREQIRSYVQQRTEKDLQLLINLARENSEIPEEFFFLVIEATRIYRENNLQNPERWNARSTLSAFSSRTVVFDTIETMYRKEIFSRLSKQIRGVQLTLNADMTDFQERLGRNLTTADRNDVMQQALTLLRTRIDRFGLTAPITRRQGENQIYVEIVGNAYVLLDIDKIIMGRGSLTFHIVDEEATTAFNTFYNSNPAHTFNSRGELINPTIITPNVLICGVYFKDNYGLDVQTRNTEGNLEYVAIRKEVGLDGNHIRSAEVSQNSLDERPIVTFLLDSEGGTIFYRLTVANIGRKMAIVLEDRVRSLATIRTAIRDAVSLEGFALDEAQNIALLLRTPNLPITLTIISHRILGGIVN